MDVAIIIPTLNRAGLLREAVVSALACEPAPAEIVVVDCGSTDDTREVIRGFGDALRFVTGPFRNAAAARNAGAAATTSPSLGFLDSDDLALPGKTGMLEDVLTADGALALAHGTIEVIDERGRALPSVTARHASYRSRGRRLGTSYASLAAYCWMYTSATLIRRTAFAAVGGYDEELDIYEDWDLYLRLSLAGALRYVDAPAALYRVWPGNVPWDRTACGVVAVARKHLGMLPAVPSDARRDAELAFRGRIAGSLHTLVDLPGAGREGAVGVRLDPRRALRDPAIRRALTRSFLPASLVERRRAPRTQPR